MAKKTESNKRGKRSGKNVAASSIPKETAGAVAGAAIGSIAGPIGAVVGGVAGAIAGKAAAQGKPMVPTLTKAVKKVVPTPRLATKRRSSAKSASRTKQKPR